MIRDADAGRLVEARLRATAPPRPDPALEARVLRAARAAWRDTDREAPAGLVWLWPVAAAAAVLLAVGAAQSSDRLLARRAPVDPGAARAAGAGALWAAHEAGAPWRAFARAAAARRPPMWCSLRDAGAFLGEDG